MPSIIDHYNKQKNNVQFPLKYDTYYHNILEKIDLLYNNSKEARNNGYDPSLNVETEIVLDLADRVEHLLELPGLASRLRELLKTFSKEKAALAIAEEVAIGKFGFFDKERALDLGVRVGLAIITDGITVAPIQGISNVVIKKNDDGTDYASVCFAGPIRSAGGTEAAFTLLIADHIRKVLGIEKYRPDGAGQDEAGRFLEELRIYERDVGNFQYKITDEDLRITLLHLPVEIDGVETDPIEVVAYRGLKRITTDRVRGGALRVINDGVIGRSNKLLKIVNENPLLTNDWEWLSQLKGRKNKDVDKIRTESTHFGEIIAGRAVLSFPKKSGGFRLRYGRSYNTGLATIGIHPSVTILLDHPVVPGTQIKLDTPSKAATVAFVDTIETPIVKLKDDSIVKIKNIEHANQMHDKIAEIIHLGDILISYGDFLENNVKLYPSGYVEEWWNQDLKEAIKKKFGSIEKFVQIFSMKKQRLKNLINDPLYTHPNVIEAFELSKKLNIPLHPKYVFFWDLLSPPEIITLKQNLKLKKLENSSHQVFAKRDPSLKSILEKAGIPHIIVNNNIIIQEDDAYCIIKTLDLPSQSNIFGDWKNVTDYLSSIAHIPIKPKSSVYIGLRVGRPEKAMPRKMKPPVHILFPIGMEGGSTRNIIQAAKQDFIDIDIINLVCLKCGSPSITIKCKKCGGDTTPIRKCPNCGRKVENINCPMCRINAQSHSKHLFPIKQNLREAIIKLKYKPKKLLKGVKGLSNVTRMPELLEKGILREKYGLFVYKDGTSRFDATNVTLTHFRPSQIGTPIETLKKLGYNYDIFNKPLEKEDQLLELFVQDVILPSKAGDYLLNVSKFIDQLLVDIYNKKSHYNTKSINDLIGHLVIGLAPHTSVGIIGRIIGFTPTQVCFAHPYWHASKRRDCDGDEDALMLLQDVFLNFSKEFLPAQIGGLMDAPLLLQLIIIPAEIDEQSHNFDVCKQYPLEFYEKTLKNIMPIEILDKMDLIKNRLKDETQFYNFDFTHPTKEISTSKSINSYSTLKSLFEKLEKQIELAKKIRAVNPDEVVASVLKTHLLPDIIGNLKAYTSQSFRCKKCGETYRRIPIKGNCLNCDGNLQASITRKSVEKYLKISLDLSNKFKITNYLKNRFEITYEEIFSIFGKENEKEEQLELTTFINPSEK
jgi:DNA polymerase II large subunit